MKIDGIGTYTGQVVFVTEKQGSAQAERKSSDAGGTASKPAQASRSQPISSFTRNGPTDSIFDQRPALPDPRLQTASVPADRLLPRLGIAGPDSGKSDGVGGDVLNNPFGDDGQRPKVGEWKRDERHPAPDSPDTLTKAKPFEPEEARMKRDLDRRAGQFNEGVRRGLEEKGLDANLGSRWSVRSGAPRPRAGEEGFTDSSGPGQAGANDLDRLKQLRPDPQAPEGAFGDLPAVKDPMSYGNATEFRNSMASAEPDRVGPILHYRDHSTGLAANVQYDSKGRPHLDMVRGEKVRSSVHDGGSFDSIVKHDGVGYNIHYNPNAEGSKVTVLTIGKDPDQSKKGGSGSGSSGAAGSQATSTPGGKTKGESKPSKKPSGSSEHPDPDRADRTDAGDVTITPMREKLTNPAEPNARPFDIERLIGKTVVLAMSRVNPSPLDGPHSREPLVAPKNPVADPVDLPTSHVKVRPPRPDGVGPVRGDVTDSAGQDGSQGGR